MCVCVCVREREREREKEREREVVGIRAAFMSDIRVRLLSWKNSINPFIFKKINK